jgi:hypothetical protein
MNRPGRSGPISCYLAEGYLSAHDPETFESLVTELRTANQTSRFRLLQAIYVPDDETCFVLIQARTADDVLRDAATPHLRFHRAKAALRVGLVAPTHGVVPLSTTQPDPAHSR